MSVREAKTRIYADEFVRWIVYDQVEGLTPVSSQQFAQMCAMMCNYLQHGPGHRFTPQDFLPQWDPPRLMTPQSPAVLEHNLQLALGM